MQPAAQALARPARVSKASHSSLERGTGNPSIESVRALAKALNVPFGEFFYAAALARPVRLLLLTDYN